MTITIAASAPTLYYQCSAHAGMGGQINTNSTLGSSNFDGSIQSTVKANSSSGFSIGLFTGTGSNASIGHGLGVFGYAMLCAFGLGFLIEKHYKIIILVRTGINNRPWFIKFIILF